MSFGSSAGLLMQQLAKSVQKGVAMFRDTKAFSGRSGAALQEVDQRLGGARGLVIPDEVPGALHDRQL
jgi:hypothetical protein